MSFYKKKKVNQFRIFEQLLKNKSSFFLLSVTQLTIEEKLQLKQDFRKINYDFIVLKNKVFTKQIKQNYPNLINLVSLVQGFCIILYPISINTEGPTDYDMIKNLGVFLEKKTNLFFLGGFFENKLINKNFLIEVMTLKSFNTIYQNIINLISQPQRNLHNIMQSPSNKVYYPIQELSKDKKDV